MGVPIPDQLVARAAEGQTVLFVGAGMSQRQLPGWRQLLKDMLAWARGESISLGEGEGDIGELIAREKLTLAAQELRLGMGEANFCRCAQHLQPEGPEAVSGPRAAPAAWLRGDLDDELRQTD